LNLDESEAFSVSLTPILLLLLLTSSLTSDWNIAPDSPPAFPAVASPGLSAISVLAAGIGSAAIAVFSPVTVGAGAFVRLLQSWVHSLGKETERKPTYGNYR